MLADHDDKSRVLIPLEPVLAPPHDAVRERAHGLGREAGGGEAGGGGM